MDYKDYRDICFKLALENGCSAAEAYFSSGDDLTIGVLDGELDTYSVSNTAGFSLRVKLDGKDGYAYTELMEDASSLVMRAMDNARTVDAADEHPMQGKSEYAVLPDKKDDFYDLSTAEKIEFAKSIEKASLAADPLVVRTMMNRVSCMGSSVKISNTFGLDASSSGRWSAAIAAPVVRKDDQLKNAYVVRFGEKLRDVDGLAKEATRKAIAELGGTPVPSGKYRVLFDHECMTDMLEFFAPVFSAELVQKGLSFLSGMEGEKVFGDNITITDDPLSDFSPRAFDDEGVPSVKTAVVEGGRLLSLLHNLKTAKKSGVASTSNGSRSNASSPVTVAPTNMYVEGGEFTMEQLTEKLGSGLIINSLGGLHAGLNNVTGDFSVLASGQLVENGVIVRPVERVTVSGNYRTLLSTVEALGNDCEFMMPGRSNVACPSLLVSGISVSGE